MQQPKQSPTRTPLDVTILRFSLAILLFSAVGCSVFLKLNRNIATTVGKVTDTFSDKVIVGRKQTANKEFAVFTYTINGTQRRGKTELRQMGSAFHSRDFIPVYYYPWFPGHVWFYTRANATMPICIGFALLGSIGAAYSSNEIMRRKRLKALALAKQQVKKKKYGDDEAPSRTT
jgi:hypothetical protein